MENLYVSAAMFAFVFFKAFQQRNVAFDHYVPVIPTSMLMAAVEVYIIASIATRGYSFLLVLSIGGGAGVGALLAMYLHKRIFGGKKQ